MKKPRKPRTTLSAYEKALRAGSRAYKKLLEAKLAASKETAADRERIKAKNLMRQGRPARNLVGVAQKVESDYQKAIELIRKIEADEGLEEKPEHEIHSHYDPIQNKPKTSGHSGRPKNNEIDDLEVVLRRIQRRISNIESGREATPEHKKASKLARCQMQVKGILEQIAAIEATMSEADLHYQQIKRTRMERRTAKAELKRVKMLCMVDGTSDEVIDENGNINEPVLKAQNKIKELNEYIETLEARHIELYGDFKNEKEGLDPNARRELKLDLAVSQSLVLKHQKARDKVVEQKIRKRPQSKNPRFRDDYKR